MTSKQSIIVSKIDKNRCKQKLASLPWACRSSQFSVILNQPRITAYVVNRHALPTVPVYKKTRIASLLCIFETTIPSPFGTFNIILKHLDTKHCGKKLFSSSFIFRLIQGPFTARIMTRSSDVNKTSIMETNFVILHCKGIHNVDECFMRIVRVSLTVSK